MASPPEEQAVLTVRLGPVILWSMANCCRGDIAHDFRHEAWADGLMRQAGRLLGLADAGQARQSGAHDDATAVVRGQAAHRQRFVGGDVGELHKAVQVRRQAARQQGGGVKIRDLRRCVNLQGRGIKRGDRPDPTAACQQAIPKFCHTDADRRHSAHPGDHDLSFHLHCAPLDLLEGQAGIVTAEAQGGGEDQVHLRPAGGQRDIV